MILVDTSVLIDFFNGKITPQTKKLTLANNGPFSVYITSFIYQEILQGAKTDKDFKQLKSYLESLPFILPKHHQSTFEKAAELYKSCRKKGLTIRSSIDCLIAQLCIENNLYLLHNDTDFFHIQTITKNLRFL